MTTTSRPQTSDPAVRFDRELEGRVPAVERPHSWRWWLAGVLLVLIAAEVGARVLETTNPPAIAWYDATSQLKVEMMDRGEADVVFVGTSMAWQGFVPAAFERFDAEERTSFNAALAGAVPVVMEPWITDQVLPRLDSDLVVWGLSSLDFAPEYGDQQFEAYTTAVETRSGTIADAERFGRSHSSLFRMREFFRRPNRLWGAVADETRRELVAADRITGDGGERLDFSKDQTDDRGAVVSARLRDYTEADAQDLAAIRSTVQQLHSEGREVVFVQMPVPDRFIERHPDGESSYQITTSTLAELGAELGVDVILADEMFTDRSFVDFTHLDESAALHLTKSIATALTERASVEVGNCTPIEIVGELGFRDHLPVCRYAG